MEKLLNLIKDGKEEQALKSLMRLTQGRDINIYNELILISARLSSNDELFRQNILKVEDSVLEKNKIRKSLIHCINDFVNSEYFEKSSLDELTEDGTINKKVKILFLGSNPTYTTKFEIEKEYLQIRRIFNKKREQFEVCELFNTTLEGLFETVKNERPDILHISSPSTIDYLVLHKKDETIRAVPYHILADTFIMFQPYVKCILMNTRCSSIFLKKVSHFLGYAIGSRDLIRDDLSILFSSGFYTAVAEGKNIGEAFSFGVNMINEYSQSNTPYIMFNLGISSNPEYPTSDDFNINLPEEIVENYNINKQKANQRNIGGSMSFGGGISFDDD